MENQSVKTNCCEAMELALREKYLDTRISFDEHMKLRVLGIVVNPPRTKDRRNLPLLINSCPWCGALLMETKVQG